jgi:hypothetical protein
VSEHRNYFKWGSVSHWKGNVASTIGQSKRVEIEIGFGLNKETIRFDMEDGMRLEATTRALDLAVSIGDGLAREDIRKCLGIKEARS